MATVGYATLQVIPSFKGLANQIMRQAQESVGGAGKVIEKGLTDAGERGGSGLGSRIRSGIDTARGAVGGLLGDLGAVAVAAGGIGQAIEQNTNRAQIQAALGLSPAEAQAAARVAGGLYAKGWGESLDDVSGALKTVAQQLGDVSDPAQLRALTRQALAFGEAFGLDATESVRAVSQMMRTGLATNAKEAFDIIAAGEQNGADKAGDLLDTFNEYGTQFRKLGLDGKTALGLIQQGLQGGARDADKVADALKEFSIRAVDGSKTTAAGFKLLGLNANTMADRIGKGGSSASGALDQVLGKLRGIKDPVKQSQAAVDLFGTQAEDLGQALYSLDPASTASARGMGKVDGAAKRVADTLGKSQPPVEQLKRSFQQALGSLAAGALPVLKPILDWLKTSGPLLAKIAVGFAGLVVVNKSVGAIRSVAGGIRDTVSAARTGASAVVSFGKGVGRVGAAGGRGIAAAARGFGSLATTMATGARSALLFAVNLGKAGLAAAGAAIKTVALKVASVAVSVATKAWAAIQWILDAALNANPLGLIVIAIAALVAGIVLAWKNSETFRKVVIGAWNAIKVAAVAVFRFIGRFVSAVWGGIKVAAKAVWGGILAYFRFVTGAYRAVFTAVWGGIKRALSATWNAIKTAALAVFNGLKAYFTAVLKGYRVVFTAIWNGIKVAVSVVWRAILAVIHGAANRIKAAIEGLKAIVGRVRAFFQGAYDAARGRLNALTSFVRGIPGKILGYFRGVTSRMRSIGSEIVAGLRNGVTSAWHHVTDTISGLVNKIPKKIRSMLGIASPSRVMADLFRWVPAGAAKGIESGTSLVDRAAGRMARAAAVAPPAYAGSVPSTPGAASAAGRPPVTVNLHGSTLSTAEQVQRVGLAVVGVLKRG